MKTEKTTIKIKGEVKMRRVISPYVQGLIAKGWRLVKNEKEINIETQSEQFTYELESPEILFL